MKKNYQKPNIKVKGIELESPLATSPGVESNVGIKHSPEGTPPTEATSKHGFLDDNNEPSAPSSVWDD